MEAVLTDDAGETHHVTYSGAVKADEPEAEYDYDVVMTEFYIEAAPEEGLGGEDEYMT